MLRGTLIVFNAIFAVVLLKKRLYPHHWVCIFACFCQQCYQIGVFSIMTGVALVGLASVLFKSNATYARAPVLGGALVVCAQVISAIQYVYEEKVLSSYKCQPLQVVGYEGFFGMCMATIVLFILYFIPGHDAGSVENAPYALAQMLNSGKLFVAGMLYCFPYRCN